MRKFTTIALIAFLSVPVLPHAGALAKEGVLKINPGMYKITGSTKTNLDEKPQVKTSEVCIPESEIRPETMLPPDGNCKIKNLKSSDNKASFDIDCSGTDNVSTLKGKAEYSTDGDKFMFKFNLDGKSSGKEIKVDSEGSAERTGDCP